MRHSALMSYGQATFIEISAQAGCYQFESPEFLQHANTEQITYTPDNI